MVLPLPPVGATVWLHVHALSADRGRPVLPRCERGNPGSAVRGALAGFGNAVAAALLRDATPLLALTPRGAASAGSPHSLAGLVAHRC
jgi:hypothetical protein